MISLVTLQQAKNHLRVDYDIDDADIQDKIDQASAVILNYLKISWKGTIAGGIPDWSGSTALGSPMAGVPKDIQSACLLIVSELYHNREASNSVPLSQTVLDLLHRWRTPALA